MKDDFLIKIKEAEQAAEAKVSDARENAQMIEQNARDKAKSLRDESASYIEQMTRNGLSEGKELSERKLKNQLSMLNVELGEIRQNVSGKMDSAVSFIFEKVVNN